VIAIMQAVGKLGARVDGCPSFVVVAQPPSTDTFKISLGADAGNEAQPNVAGGSHGPGRVDGGTGSAAAMPLEQGGRGRRADAVVAAVNRRRG
jgi:hypothetical protein